MNSECAIESDAKKAQRAYIRLLLFIAAVGALIADTVCTFNSTVRHGHDEYWSKGAAAGTLVTICLIATAISTILGMYRPLRSLTTWLVVWLTLALLSIPVCLM